MYRNYNLIYIYESKMLMLVFKAMILVRRLVKSYSRFVIKKKYIYGVLRCATRNAEPVARCVGGAMHCRVG